MYTFQVSNCFSVFRVYKIISLTGQSYRAEDFTGESKDASCIYIYVDRYKKVYKTYLTTTFCLSYVFSGILY